MKSKKESLLITQKAKAQKEINHKILLSKRDQEVFFEAICNPPEPNNNLRKAAVRYNMIVEKENGMV